MQVVRSIIVLMNKAFSENIAELLQDMDQDEDESESDAFGRDDDTDDHMINHDNNTE